MAEEGTGVPPSSIGTAVPPARDGGRAAAVPPKDPGWYPVRSSPNEQIYWDGHDWAGRRHWTPGAGWTEIAPDHTAATGPASDDAPRTAPNPFAPKPRATAKIPESVPGVTLASFLLMSSAIAMMVGSVTTWITASAAFASRTFLGGTGASISTSVSGVDSGMSQLIGLNGDITFIAGAVVLLFGGLSVVTHETSVRIVGFTLSLASLGLASYAVVRLAQKLGAAHPPGSITVGIGWGLLLVLGGAFMAVLVSLYQATRNR